MTTIFLRIQFLGFPEYAEWRTLNCEGLQDLDELTARLIAIEAARGNFIVAAKWTSYSGIVIVNFEAEIAPESGIKA